VIQEELDLLFFLICWAHGGILLKRETMRGGQEARSWECALELTPSPLKIGLVSVSVMLGGGEQLRLQLFADVQAKAGGPVLELVLMSREAMGKGAPQTRHWFDQLAAAAAETMPQLELVFRSDRDGPLPDGG